MDRPNTEPRNASSPPAELPLNIAILSYGTRGDIQPYIRITQELSSNGHRVRLTVPPSLETWVRDQYGIETWNLKHDMGKFTRWSLHKPGKKVLSMVNGEFRDLKVQMGELLVEHWRACVDAGPSSKNTGTEKRPFVADVILASPPGMTHVHIAQRLGVPLLLTHFNPKTITRQWPHGDRYPSDKVFKPCDENKEGWIAGDSRIWKRYYKGIVNKIRKRHLDLPPLESDFWPVKFWDLEIPVAYLISPYALPRPDDFPVNHHFVGFTHLDQLQGFHPDTTLVEFLSGPGPVIYVDFGSNEWLDRRGLTSAVLKAVERNDARAVIRKSWFAADSIPTGVFVTEEVPHSWLFPRVDLVLHSAGAGITAISLKSGVPSAIMPFRGDQNLWCKAIERLGAAPPALHVKEVTEVKLTELIKEALAPKYQVAAKKAAEAMKIEPDGAINVVKILQEHLTKIDGYPPRCSLLPDRRAVWQVKQRPEVKLSALAAHFLDAEKTLSYEQLELIKVVDWDKYESLRPWEAGRNRRDDVVKKQRVAQGNFDAKGNESLSDEVLERWGRLEGSKPSANGA